jgi:hypothetical protein
MPVSARDSLAISYQSPALDLIFDEVGEDPKMSRSDPNASITGATVIYIISPLNNASMDNPLTIHFDATLPFVQLLCINSFNWTAREGRLRGRGIPIWWEELDINLSNERQRCNLRLECQVCGMAHKFDNWEIKIKRWR